MTKKATFFVLACLLTATLWGMQFKFVKKISISQENITIGVPTSFFVTEDNKIFMTDFKLPSIKIFSMGGSHIKTFGRKGPGPNEFFAPIYLDYHGSRFGLLDAAKRRVFIYTRNNEAGPGIREIAQVSCLGGGKDLAVLGDEVLIAGYLTDKNNNPFALYSKNIRTNDINYYISSQLKHGLDSLTSEQYFIEYKNNPKYRTIGMDAHFDWFGNNVYYVWMGKLRIVRVDLKSGTKSFFGESTAGYIKPEPSRKLYKAIEKRDSRAIYTERNKLMLIRTLFAGNKFVSIAYTRPSKNHSSMMELIFQFYTPDGKFLNEVIHSEVLFPPIFHFQKDKDLLYLLSYDEPKDTMIFFIAVYKIE